MTVEPALSVVVPAFQEGATVQQSLERLSTELKRLDLDHEIILVSDGSSDDTADRARRSTVPHLTVIEYHPNRGKGHALRVGTQRARGALVAFIDADLDIHPAGIIRMVEMLERSEADAVVGSKVHAESHVKYPPFRRMQSRVFRWIVKAGFHLDVADSQTGLKLFRRCVLSDCLPLVQSSGFVFDLELLVLANDAGYRIVEGPVDLDYQFSTTTGVRAALAMIREVACLHRHRRRAQRAGDWVPRRR